MSSSGSMGRGDVAGDAVEGPFYEPVRFRYMRYGLPSGLLFFVVVAVSLAEGMTLPAVLFFAAVLLLIIQAAALATLTAHRVALTTEVLTARTVLQEVRIPWDRIRTVELVDRKDLAFPRRLLRIAGDGRELFVFDSIEQFDWLLGQVANRSAVEPAPMPAWKRVALLQWGV